MPSSIDRLLSDPHRNQREKLELLQTNWRLALEQLDDAELYEHLRAIRKAINSKKLRASVDALIGVLRRDGAQGPAPLPKRTPAPAPVAEVVEPKPTDTHRNRDFEAKLAADPRDAATYLVYRDWLESQGFVHDGRVTIGPLADCEDMLDGLEWQHGFIRAARVHYNPERYSGARPELRVEQALEWLLDNPGPGRFVERLTIGLVYPWADNHYGDVCRVIGARLRPALTELFLGDFEPEESELNWSSIVTVPRLWASMPRLRKLRLRAGSMQLDGINLPELRELETVSGGLPPEALAAIASASWPKLERLSLQVGRGDYGAATDVSLVEPILAGTQFPALKHLGICNCEFTDELCERLASAPILPQLRSLDLSMGTMDMPGAQALARTPRAFAHLEHINVEDNFLPDAAEDLLRTLGPTIEFGYQRVDGGTHRYASAYE